MGLDMYLEGQKFFWSFDEFKREKEDGFEVKCKVLELGYWRKFADLHGFIVQNFAGGKDECQDIDLGKEDLEKIIEALKTKTLPHTEGFFFRYNATPEDEEADRQDGIRMIQGALDWLTHSPDHESRSVVYRASW